MKKTSLKETLRKKKFFILDGDGTLYLWEKPLKDASNFIKAIKRNGKNFIILSNNDDVNKEERLRILSKILRIDIRADELLIPTDAVKIFLEENKIRRFDGLITESTKKELTAHGFKFDSKNPEIIIIGFDIELNYDKIIRVIEHINRGVDFILTHVDPLCPFRNNQQIPDAGLIVKLIEKATNKKPIKVFGKPYEEFVDLALSIHKSSREESIIIGDRLNTDIKMAYKSGIDSIWINNNKTKISIYKPNFSVRSISELYKIFISSHSTS